VVGAGDYLLWEWSLGGNHDTMALIAGLTLPPLAIACIWLLAVNFARLLTDTARRPRLRLATRRQANALRGDGEPTDSSSDSWKDEPVPGSSSSKLAA
jgi:hypothetical protein